MIDTKQIQVITEFRIHLLTYLNIVHLQLELIITLPLWAYKVQ